MTVSSNLTRGLDTAVNILLVGKSGSGKSTLISKVCTINEDEAGVERYQPGEQSIDRSVAYSSSRVLCLHESKGLQNGSSQALTDVRDLVERRKNAPAAERLHAIWYCVEAPTAGGRAFEAGDITLLESLNKSGSKVPVIIVFTKFDRARFREQRRLQKEYIRAGMGEKQAAIQAKADSESAVPKTYDEVCVSALKNSLPPETWTSHCAVSMKDEKSIMSLVTCTTSLIAS